MLKWLHTKLERYCCRCVRFYTMNRHVIYKGGVHDPTATRRFKLASWLEFKLRRWAYPKRRGG